MALVSVFFGAIAFFMGHEAIVNDRGLVISGLIHFGQTGATIFYGCIAAIGAAFAAIGIHSFFVGVFSTRQITLTVSEIAAPKVGFLRPAAIVKFADIQHLSTRVVQKQRFLTVAHTHGKLTINESFLPNRGAFEALCNEIEYRARSSG